MLKIQNLSISCKDKTIVQNINLSVTKGEFVTIVGKSGCGKTTLLNTIAGFESPNFETTGKITKPKNIGYIFQESSLFLWMTVRQNLLFGAKDKMIDTAKFLQDIGLKDKENYYPTQLSGGQKQRMALGQTILNNPELILMDEPFGSLDDISRREIWIWLKRVVKKYKLTIVMVTHSTAEAQFLSDRIYEINNLTIITTT